MPGLVVTIVGGLEFGWGEVVAVLVDSSVVEPVDPFHGRDLDLVAVATGAARFDELGFVEPVDCLRESVVA